MQNWQNYYKMDLTDLFIGMSTKKKIETRNLDNNNLTRFPLNASFQGVRRLFVLAFNNTNATIPNNLINNTANRVERNSQKIFSSKNKYY